MARRVSPREPLVEARGLAVRFPTETRDALREIDLCVGQGECVAVLGPSGSGKSTLALALTGAIPHLIAAECRGSVHWPGACKQPAGFAGAGRAAMVLQDSEAQLVALTVEEELAFALENRSLPGAEIDRRISQVLSCPPAQGLFAGQATLSLSGGWRQRLALAAALAENPALLVIDEPTAHLEEGAAAAALDAVGAARKAGAAALLVEHRADLACRIADRLLVLDRDGGLMHLGPPTAILPALASAPSGLGLRMPPEVQAHAALRRAGFLPAQTFASLEELAGSVAAACTADAAALRLVVDSLGLSRIATPAVRRGLPLIECDAVEIERGGRTVLGALDFTVHAGEVVGVAGANGAGKTTLLLAAAGSLTPCRGRIVRSGPPPVFVPQSPVLAFSAPTLRQEAERRRLDWRQAEAALEAFGITADPARHPLRHSQGELRRIALALAFADARPRAVLLDEPAAGLDQNGLDHLQRDVARLASRGCGVILISHDLDVLASIASRIVVLAHGRCVADDHAAAILYQAAEGRLPIAPPPAAALARKLGWRGADA